MRERGQPVPVEGAQSGKRVRDESGDRRQPFPLLFGVDAKDPLTYVLVSASLAATLLFGTYLPARRAARIDPVTALRSE